MKVAVITPYFEAGEDWLKKCHESVLAQTHHCTQFFVADGAPQDVISDFDAQHIVLGANHGDYGNPPRAIGSVSAIGQGFDAIAWLDADNWYEPNHIESLVGLHRKQGAAICTSSRMIYGSNGAPLGLCPNVDGKKFFDTNCYLLTRAAYELISVWYEMEPRLHPVGDMER
ncbi:MAG: glycosyltransferase [Alphaproteobacteria bacterium]